MSLRARLALWLLLALGLLLVPLGYLTVREAQQAAQATLEQAALGRLGLLQAQGVRLGDLAGLVQEYGGVGFVLRGGVATFTDTGTYELPEGLEATLQEGRSFRKIYGDTLWVALPGEEAAVGLGLPLGEVATLPRRLLGIYLGLGSLLALLAFGVGAWGLWRSLRPLEQVSQELARRSPEHLEPLPRPHLAELRPAVGAMNTLMGELDNALQRLKTQEQAARRFAYGASHELRNPLAALRGYLEVLSRRPGETRALEGARHQAQRMQTLLEGLLVLARLEGQGRVAGQPLDLRDWLVQHLPHLSLEGQGVVLAERRLLALAVENLLHNAERHGLGAVRLMLEAERNGVWLWVYDRGPGFAPELIPRAFEAFVKQEGSDGVGLGLALTAAVAQVMGGQARAENLPQGGARVGIWLPQP